MTLIVATWCTDCLGVMAALQWRPLVLLLFFVLQVVLLLVVSLTSLDDFPALYLLLRAVVGLAGLQVNHMRPEYSPNRVAVGLTR